MTNSISPPQTSSQGSLSPGELWPASTILNPLQFRREGGDEDKQRRAHQASDERIHGVVSDEETSDSAGQPEDAQFRDLEAARL